MHLPMRKLKLKISSTRDISKVGHPEALKPEGYHGDVFMLGLYCCFRNNRNCSVNDSRECCRKNYYKNRGIVINNSPVFLMRKSNTTILNPERYHGNIFMFGLYCCFRNNRSCSVSDNGRYGNKKYYKISGVV